MPHYLDSNLNSLCQWDKHTESLKEHVLKKTLPTVVRVKSGQYGDIGCKRRLHNVLYIHSCKPELCVMAEGQMSNMKHHLFAIPLSYTGWFDVLNEAKKPILPLTYGEEIKSSEANVYLLRESLKVVSGVVQDGVVRRDKPRVLPEGEIIFIDKIQLSPQNSESSKEKVPVFCKDRTGDIFFIESYQKIKVSPVSDKSDVLGVNSIKNICRNFIFPISVQLAYGEYLGNHRYHPIFRLVGFSKISTAVVAPINQPSLVMTLPLNEVLMVEGIENIEELRASGDWTKLQHAVGDREVAAKTKMMNLTSGHIRISKGEKKRDSFVEVDKSMQETYDQVNDIYRWIREGFSPPSEDVDANLKSAANKEATEATTEAKTEALKRPTDDDTAIWNEPLYAGISQAKSLRMKKEEGMKCSQMSNYALHDVPTLKNKKHSERLKTWKNSEPAKNRKVSRFSLFSNLFKTNHLHVESDDDGVSSWDDEDVAEKIIAGREALRMNGYTGSNSTLLPTNPRDLRITTADGELLVLGSPRESLKSRKPSLNEPPNSMPTIHEPTTSEPTTPEPTIHEPTTPEPTTPEPTIQTPIFPVTTTPLHATNEQATQANLSKPSSILNNSKESSIQHIKHSGPQLVTGVVTEWQVQIVWCLLLKP